MTDCCSTSTQTAELCACDEGINLLDDAPSASAIQIHPFTRREVLKYMGGFVLTGFLAACGQTASAPGTRDGATVQAGKNGGKLQKLDLAFCSQVLCVLPFEVAKQQGYFEEAGYDVNLVYMKGGTQAITALLSKGVDFVGTPMDLVVRSVDEGKDVRMVASTSRLPFFALVTAPEQAEAITSVAGLAGKRVGVGNLGTTDDLLLRTLAVKNKIDPEEIESVALGPNLADTLLRGEVDAGMVQEPALTLVTEKGGRLLANFMDLKETTETLGGAYQFMGLNTRPDVIEEQPDTLRALARALVRANAWILEHSGADIVKAAPEELVAGGNTEVFAKALDRYKQSLYPGDGIIEEANVRRVVDAQRAAGLIDEGKEIDLSSLFTNEFIESQG